MNALEDAIEDLSSVGILLQPQTGTNLPTQLQYGYYTPMQATAHNKPIFSDGRKVFCIGPADGGHLNSSYISRPKESEVFPEILDVDGVKYITLGKRSYAIHSQRKTMPEVDSVVATDQFIEYQKRLLTLIRQQLTVLTTVAKAGGRIVRVR